jgi:Uma2 family endonuclease
VSAPARPTPRMTAAEFLDWAAGQESRYELVRGRPVSISPETIGHVRTKGAVMRAFDDAVGATELPFTVLTSGMGVVTEPDTVRDPDCSIIPNDKLDLEAVTLDDPIVLIEVSWSGMSGGECSKLVEYFSLPSVHHYLTVQPEQAVVVHHRRKEDGDIRTRIVGSGDIVLTPPGISVPVARLLGAA